MHDARSWIDRLQLRPHPEGGWYRETYRSDRTVPTAYGDRSAGTAILYLLERGQFSALHRIRSDEIWHFHTGAGLQIAAIDEGGEVAVHRLGLRADRGELPQLVVPAGVWFGARLDPGATEHFTLAGCTVAPGFDFADFEMGRAEELRRRFPRAEEWVQALTRD